jgi:hypothetical protein
MRRKWLLAVGIFHSYLCPQRGEGMDVRVKNRHEAEGGSVAWKLSAAG